MQTSLKLPQDEEAERCVLGALLFHPPCWDEIASLVSAADFYDKRHDAIFAAIAACQGEGNSRHADIVVVAGRMRQDRTMGMLSACGSEAYLAQLANEIGSWEHAAQHAQIVREKAMLRRLAIVGSEIRNLAVNDDRPTMDVVNIAQQKMAEVMDTAIGTEPVRLKKAMHKTLMRIDERKRNVRAIVGVPTGLMDLDEKTAGLCAGQFIIIAARPSMGKTALATQICLNAAEQNIPVLAFSLEMSSESLCTRILAGLARVDSMGLRTGLIRDEDIVRMSLKFSQIGNAPMWLDDGSAQTVETIAAKARRWRRKEAGQGQCLVMVDYLQLVRATPSSKGSQTNREQEVSHVSRSLKALAKDIGAAVVALAQLNRQLAARADKRPVLSDLRESGSIEQDGDVIMALHRPEVYETDKPELKGMAEAIILKQRDGETGIVDLVWRPEFTRFENASKRRE